MVKCNSSLLILKGDAVVVWQKLVSTYDINSVFINKDYEPYSISRDTKIKKLLRKKGISLLTFKDQVIFEEKEIVKNDNNPYTIFTPYKNRWLQKIISAPGQYETHEIADSFQFSACSIRKFQDKI